MRYDCRMTNENDEAPSALQRLPDQLYVTEKDTDTFDRAPGEGWRRLFGAHVAAHALLAAPRPVSARALPSFPASFLRARGRDRASRCVLEAAGDGGRAESGAARCRAG